jgi:hypothetical protein
LNGSKTVNFLAVSPSNTNWLSGAVKVHISETNSLGALVEANVIQGYAGSVVPVTVSVHAADINSGESFTFTPSAIPMSSLEPAGSFSFSPVTINATQLSQVVNFTIPTTAALGTKWVLEVATAAGARAGNAQVVVESLGAPILTIAVPSSVTMNTGTPFTTQALATNGTLAVSNVVYELQGAPDGVTINAAGQITCNVLTPGVYSFSVLATASGYARSQSAAIALVVVATNSPLSIMTASSSLSAVTSSTVFQISWASTGVADALFLAQYPSPSPVRIVTGGTSASVQQAATSVYAVYGSNYYGYTYSVPLLCTLSSIQQGAALLPSPTIASIDVTNTLRVNWMPYPVDGGYSIYRGWDIILTTGGVTTTTLVGGGALSALAAASYTTVVPSGDYMMDMVALSSNLVEALNSPNWDNPHAFPSALQSSSVLFSSATVQLGQSFNVSLNSSYTTADMWRVDFPDNTSTGWIPVSSRTVPKSFASVPPSTTVVVTVQKNYGTNNPPVYLQRSIEVPIVVSPSQYVSPTATEDTLTTMEGMGGNQGFEITSSITSTAPPEPYEVIVRMLVRDTVTNELVLMLPTSRYSNASSLEGTMAIDVFPIYGRPHVKELIKPTLALSTNSNSSIIPVSIETISLPSNYYIGKPIPSAFTMSAVGGTAPYCWYASNLPSGLEINIDGTISGVPTQLGNFSVTFVAMDSSSPVYIAETTLVFPILTDLGIVTSSLSSMTVGTPYACQLTNTGGILPFSWSLVGGSLPLGLSVNKNTGLISGTPCTYNSTVDFTTPYTPTIQVQDAVGAIATQTYNCSLQPTALGFGVLDQPRISAQEEFKLVVPVKGGASPYTLTQFTDKGIIGQGLQIINPSKISVLAGVNPAALQLTTVNQTVYPQGYPANVVIELAASGGVPWNSGLPTAQSYKFYVDPTAIAANNTLPGAAVYGSLLVASPTSNGVYTVTIKVIDSAGHYTTQTLIITVQQLNSGTYTLAPYSINTNGNVSNPTTWTLTPISAFPDATTGSAYTPGSGQYYALVLMKNGAPLVNLSSAPSFSIINGSIPVGINFASPSTNANSVLVFSGTPTVLGSSSFEFQITGVDAAVTFAAATRQSITSTVTGGGTTTVVTLTRNMELDLDLNMVQVGAVNNTYNWAYPIIMEGGTPPYKLNVLTGTTLPGVNTTTVNQLPVIVSNTSIVGDYTVVVAATDSTGVSSPSASIPVRIVQSTAQLTYVINNNIPTYWYVDSPLPENTYYMDSNQVSSWSASGLPTGVSLRSTIGTRVYLTGTPTVVSQSNLFTITATSIVYGTSGSSTSTNFEINAQSAVVVVTPTAFTPIVGNTYRAINGSSFLSVVYTGYQPNSPNLPILTNSLVGAVLGSPSTTSGGQPTTENVNVTFDGFTMLFDYTTTTAGTDVITLSQSGIPMTSVNLTDMYSALLAIPQNIVQSVSEYTASAILPLPVTLSGGAAPYSIIIPAINGISDARFIPVNSLGVPVEANTPCTGIMISASGFTAGGTYSCTVPMLITDSSNQSAAVSGSLTVSITQGTTIQVAFTSAVWNIVRSSVEPYTGSFVPNFSMSTPTVGHKPYSYYVTSLLIPTGLVGFIHPSPSNRVLAFNENETSTSISVVDLDATLTGTVLSGSYAVPATNHASLPVAGTYQITVGLKVTDSLGISSTSTQTINVVVS